VDAVLFVDFGDGHQLAFDSAKARFATVRCEQQSVIRSHFDSPTLKNLKTFRLLGRELTFFTPIIPGDHLLRVSELLALRWLDIDWDNSCIRVSRAYVYGRFGPPKSKASQRPVPLLPLLADLLKAWRKDSPYFRDTDLVFPSFRLNGEKPPRANMLVANHLQPAAKKAGICGQVGFHTLRRTLASVLVAKGSDPKLVQELLRHSNVKTTLDIYAKATSSAKLEAQGWVLQQSLAPNANSASV
jgi:hypothetical protein